MHDVVPAGARPAADARRRQQVVGLAPILRDDLDVDVHAGLTQRLDLLLDEDAPEAVADRPQVRDREDLERAGT